MVYEEVVWCNGGQLAGCKREPRCRLNDGACDDMLSHKRPSPSPWFQFIPQRHHQQVSEHWTPFLLFRDDLYFVPYYTICVNRHKEMNIPSLTFLSIVSFNTALTVSFIQLCPLFGSPLSLYSPSRYFQWSRSTDTLIPGHPKLQHRMASDGLVRPNADTRVTSG